MGAAIVCTRPPFSATLVSHLSTDCGPMERKVVDDPAVPLASLTMSTMSVWSPNPSSRTTPPLSRSVLKMVATPPVDDKRFIFVSDSTRMPLEQTVIGVLADVDGVLTPLVAPKDERRALVDRADCGVLTSRRLSNDSSISISSRPCAVFLMTPMPSRPTTNDRCCSPITKLVSSDEAFRFTSRSLALNPDPGAAGAGSSMSMSSTHCCWDSSVSPSDLPTPAYTPSSFLTFSSLGSVWYLFLKR